MTPLETVMEGNESLCGSKSGCHISDLSASTQTELGNLLAVCCQAKVKNSDMHHCFTETLKAEVSQSGFNTLQDSVVLCQLKGTADSSKVTTYAWIAHSEVRKPQSFCHCSASFDLSLSEFFLLNFFQVTV